MPDERPAGGWRERLYVVVFEHGTPAGRAFDLALLFLIVASVVAVVLESVPSFRARWGAELLAVEWGFTALFTAEYVLRLLVVRRPAAYARSFFGVIDLLAVLPTYLRLLLPGSQVLLTLRAIRLLRVFRVLKLGHFLGEERVLVQALRASVRKIVIFLGAVLVIVLVTGALMYVVEGPGTGFTSIPASVYWAIVTITTVGYGDIAPQTPLGRLLAALVMMLGYGIIAVPTGIVTVEMGRASRPAPATAARRCAVCGLAGHDEDAAFCKRCGEELLAT
ncbi:MAG TPA: ion transporter [Thermoanaerobaculia bacterium]|nr:ion transporter [Thermoanaerobaculia bacterium]